MQRFIKESRIPASPEAVFAFFERPDAFERLLPPGEPVEVVETPKSLDVGARAVIRMNVGPFPIDLVGGSFDVHFVFNAADVAILIGIALLAPRLQVCALALQRRIAAWESAMKR